MDNFKDPLMKDLVGFISNAAFQTKFERFFMEHCNKFDAEEEHKLEYMEVYQEFQEMFDEEMKGFLSTQHVSEIEFTKRCRTAIEEDEFAGQYVKIILASMDYPAFHGLMLHVKERDRRVAERNKAAERAEAKAMDDDTDDNKTSGISDSKENKEEKMTKADEKDVESTEQDEDDDKAK